MDIDPIFGGAGVLTVGGILARIIYSWAIKQSSGDTLVSERDKHMIELRTELQRAKDEHADCMASIEIIKEQNTLLRIQNAMMRQLLLNKGVTESELTAIGATQ